MTVSTTTNKIRYSGTGSQYVFPYTFKIFADDDLEVILTSAAGVDTVKTLTTHYTVSGAGSGSGGNVTMITAPASGEYLTVKRNLDILQETDYVENDPFPAESHENALDRLTMICQQLNEAVDRALKISIGSGLSDIIFPPLVANEYLVVNAAGDGLETTALLSSLGSEAAAVATAKVYTDGEISTLQGEIDAVVFPKFENLNIDNTATATSFVITSDRMRLVNVSGDFKNITNISETCDATTTGANGREASLTITTGTTYFLFIIAKNDGTVNSFLDDSLVPVLPAGYTYWCCVSVLVSIATNTFKTVNQFNRWVNFLTASNVLSGGSATSATAIGLATYVPGLAYMSMVDLLLQTFTASNAQYYCDVGGQQSGEMALRSYGIGSGSIAYTISIVSGTVALDSTNSSPRIYYVNSNSNLSTNLSVRGYELKI
jgi:hypothetical protein